MYGTQDAVATWESSWTGTMKWDSFKQGVASLCHYVHADGSTLTMVHGDDFIGTGRPETLERLKAVLESKYGINCQIWGLWEGVDRIMRVRGRITTF